MRDEDLELLAEHLGGALAGTPEGDRVADLVARDPEWARAASRLSAALDAVAADLARLPAPAMPDDVATRLEGVVRGAAGGAHQPTSGASPLAAPSGSRRPPRQAGGAGDSRPPDRPRRRRAARWGAGLAVAAAAAGFAAFGVSSDLFERMWTRDDQGGAATLAEEGHTADQETHPSTLASGVDYQSGALPAEPPVASRGRPEESPPTTLENGPGVAGAPDTGSPDGESQGDVGDRYRTDGSAGVPAALRHLAPLPQSCLSAVVAGYAQPVAEVGTVDYARFEGAPALVMWVTTSDGRQWITVAGPRCGEPGAGADELHRTAAG